MGIKESISGQLKEFLMLCKSHQVKTLYVFGSSLTDRFDEDSSDIDLLIEIDDNDPVQRGEKLMSIWDKFEEFFKRKVDLLTDASIKNPILKKSIESTKVLIYDHTTEEIYR